jgi:hypothetical protein
MAEQPRDEDGTAFGAYLVKDASAERLAASLSPLLEGKAPPVVAAGAADVYPRKGRTMDRATGRPVKVFLVRVVGTATPEGDASESESHAEAVASWRASRLAGASFRYQLRKDAGAWVVESRSREGG